MPAILDAARPRHQKWHPSRVTILGNGAAKNLYSKGKQLSPFEGSCFQHLYIALRGRVPRCRPGFWLAPLLDVRGWHHIGRPMGPYVDVPTTGVMRTLPIQDNFSPLITPLEGPNSACRKTSCMKKHLEWPLKGPFYGESGSSSGEKWPNPIEFH
eukprot:symbB.v1.2.010394.t1/scaffold681.1/size173109/2